MLPFVAWLVVLAPWKKRKGHNLYCNEACKHWLVSLWLCVTLNRMIVQSKFPLLRGFLSWGLEKLTIKFTTLLHLDASSSSYSYENLMINPLLKATHLLRFTDYPSFLFFSFLPFYIPFLLERHWGELHQWSNDLFTNSLPLSSFVNVEKLFCFL